MGKVKNSVGNGEAKELMCATHGHELRWEGGMLEGKGCRVEGIGGEKNNGTTVIAQWIKYTKQRARIETSHYIRGRRGNFFAPSLLYCHENHLF